MSGTGDVSELSQAKDSRRITVWMCDECGYWRQERTTGVHTAPAEDWRGRMVAHPLRAVEFVEVQSADLDVGESASGSVGGGRGV